MAKVHTRVKRRLRMRTHKDGAKELKARKKRSNQ